MKLNHKNFENIAVGQKEAGGGRYNSGRFVCLREAKDKRHKIYARRFYVVVDASPIHDEYLTYSEAAALFTEQFETNKNNQRSKSHDQVEQNS